MVSDDILDKPLAEIAEVLRSGDTTSEALTEYAIGRHEKYGEKLNPYLTWNPELTREAAIAADACFAGGYDLGLLQGLPISIKDLYGVEGFPTYGGSAKPMADKWEKEGPVVKRIKSQLGVITGKTHTVEFAAGGIGDNIHWGAPWNPWDAHNHRGPGGSSSGAGVSLWEGSAVAAFGTDTMGSVRIPASMTGVVGLKLTFGRWSAEGIVPLRRSQDTPGPLTRSVVDAAYIFAAMDSRHDTAPLSLLEKLGRAAIDEVTLGIADPCFWEDCALNISDVVERAISELKNAGAKIVDAPSSETAALLSVVMQGGMPNNELLAFLDREVPNWREQVDPGLKSRLEMGSVQKSVEYLKLETWLSELRRQSRSNFDNVDVILAPTVPISPPVLADGKPVLDPDVPHIIGARNTCPANFLGQCAISMPVGLDSDGMPVGLQLIALGGEEEKLLACAMAVEKVIGSAAQRIGSPPVVAYQVH